MRIGVRIGAVVAVVAVVTVVSVVAVVSVVSVVSVVAVGAAVAVALGCGGGRISRQLVARGDGEAALRRGAPALPVIRRQHRQRGHHRISAFFWQDEGWGGE